MECLCNRRVYSFARQSLGKFRRMDARVDDACVDMCQLEHRCLQGHGHGTQLCFYARDVLG
jgi:hypothetical protein